jgi:hypothetical protein
MSYFSLFPSLSYAVNKKDFSKLVIARDITVRAKISEYFKNAAMTSLPYEIQDGERPEILAHRIYDRSDLHWLILLFNEIQDPTFEWPLSSAEIESMISQRYSGYSIYYPDTARTTTEFQEQDTSILSVASTLHQVLSNGSTISANIVKWNPTYNEIVVSGNDASKFDATFVPSEYDDGYARMFVDGDATKTLAFAKNISYEYAANHFEDTDGNILDPRSGPPSDPSSTSSILNRYITQVGYSQPLDVDNRTQAFKDNDAKRLIRVMKPEFISPMLSQFRTIFK